MCIRDRTSLFCKGWARLKDVLRSLDAGATRALDCAGDLDPVCDVIILSVVAQAILPKGVEAVLYDRPGFGVTSLAVSVIQHPHNQRTSRPFEHISRALDKKTKNQKKQQKNNNNTGSARLRTFAFF